MPKSRITFKRFALIGFGFLLPVLAFDDVSYALCYATLLILLGVSVAEIRGPLRLVPVFLLLYLGIGLLNISTWRGEVTASVASLYLLSTALLVLPIVFCGARDFNGPRMNPALNQRSSSYFLWTLSAHQMIVLGATLYVYVKVGPVLIEQELRFAIPTALEYTVKSAIPAVAFFPLLRLSTRKTILFLFVLLLPAVLIGARGVALTGIASYVLVLYLVQGKRVGRRPLLLALSVGLVILYSGFYLRRVYGSALLSPEDLLITYFVDDNFLLYLILPLYLGFRETIGMTADIVGGGVTNYYGAHALFFADLFTVLPGQHLSAGKSLGALAGSVQEGGLTPGLLGGLFIDFQEMSLVFFLAMGLLFVVIDRLARKIYYFAPIYIVAIVQFFHLYHRGFLKPEYITTICIALFYLFVVRIGGRSTSRGQGRLLAGRLTVVREHGLQR